MNIDIPPGDWQHGPMRTCSICDAAYYCRGYCVKHYQRWKRHGDPDVTKYLKPIDMDFIKQNSTVSENGCWVWQMSRDKKTGYANIHRKMHPTTLVHRIAYTLKNGEIPDGLEVMHKCHGGRFGCVNPDHLDTGTHAENMRSGYYNK